MFAVLLPGEIYAVKAKLCYVFYEPQPLAISCQYLTLQMLCWSWFELVWWWCWWCRNTNQATTLKTDAWIEKIVIIGLHWKPKYASLRLSSGNANGLALLKLLHWQTAVAYWNVALFHNVCIYAHIFFYAIVHFLPFHVSFLRAVLSHHSNTTPTCFTNLCKLC